jgi:acyl carrier protein
MELEDVLVEVIKIASNQFRKEELEIRESTTASDISSWNSLSHVMLIASIEDYFGIKFDLLKMVDMKSIGDIVLVTHQMQE